MNPTIINPICNLSMKLGNDLSNCINNNSWSSETSQLPLCGQGNGETDKISNQRYFELIDGQTGTCHGRYFASTPKKAANKMYNRMYQISKINRQILDDKIIICLKESTRGSDRKIYAFEASRKNTYLPDEFFRSNRKKMINYDKNNILKEIPVPNELINN